MVTIQCIRVTEWGGGAGGVLVPFGTLGQVPRTTMSPKHRYATTAHNRLTITGKQETGIPGLGRARELRTASPFGPHGELGNRKQFPGTAHNSFGELENQFGKLNPVCRNRKARFEPGTEDRENGNGEAVWP